MTDKSFGDHTDKNIVKNPLLSTAVVGLSYEELTHNAVLLPVAQNPGLISSQGSLPPFWEDGRPVIVTSRDAQSDQPENVNKPSGDATHATQHIPQATHTDNTPPKQKPKDDFDVNEYFARLQGTRYVSAPINTATDQVATIDATEENLEEINLNEAATDETQQSITADIAQNFSQLPTVLPQVASAVFSSFSSMLSMKSREQTPDVARVVTGYQDVGFERSEEVVVKDAGLPPRECVGGATQFRITTKKKAYAQIPGLSTEGHIQNPVPPQGFSLPPSVPQYSNQPAFFTPAPQDNAASFNVQSHTMPPMAPNHPTQLNISSNVTNESPASTVYASSSSHSIPMFTPSMTTQAGSLTAINKQENDTTLYSPPQEFMSKSASVTMFTPPVMSQSGMESSVLPAQTGSHPDVVQIATSQHNLISPPPADLGAISRPQPPGQAIIPPPTMFSNIPRRESTTDVKSVLPPSVARRISANQPLMKPTSAVPPCGVNIFVPSAVGAEQTPAAAPQSYSQSVPPPAFYNPTSAVSPPEPPKPDAVNVSAPPQNISYPPTFFTPSQSTPIEPPKDFSSSASYSGPQAENNSNLNQNPSGAIPPPMFFNPGSVATSIEPPNSATYSTPMNMEPAKPAFDPIAFIAQQPPEPPKVVPEPPKMASGNINFRMAKKRPQYYAGPIEGVGAISNNVKPVLAPVETANTYQGALFTPQAAHPDNPTPSQSQPYLPPSVPFEQASVPFDISKPSNTNIVPSVPYDLSQNQYNAPQQQYNTSFDLSRQTTDTYEPPREEAKGFGLIGSLKSKLSSIDINKLQNTVTTFFDPAYNSENSATESYQQNQGQQNPGMAQDQSCFSNLEIYVPYSATPTYSGPPQPQNVIAHSQTYGTNQYYPNTQEHTYENVTYPITNYPQGEINQIQDNVQGSQQPTSNDLINIFPYTQEAGQNPLQSIPTQHYFVNQQVTNENRGFMTGFNTSNQQTSSYFSEPAISNINLQNQTTTTPASSVEGTFYGDRSDAIIAENLNRNIEQLNTINTADFNVDDKEDNSKDLEVKPVEQQSATDIIPPPTFGISSVVGFNRQEMNELQFKTDNAAAGFYGPDTDNSFGKKNSATFFDDIDRSVKDTVNDDKTDECQNQHDDGINICETCREVNQPEKGDADFTSQLIENITSPIQLSNPVEVPFTENNTYEDSRRDFFNNQRSEFAEDTAKAKQELINPLDANKYDQILNYNIDKSEVRNYGWCTNKSQEPDSNVQLDHDYSFQPDPNSIGFYSNNSLFFDNILTNASDEIKAELKNAHDESPTNITRQASIPTAPPAEDLDDSKSDETGGLDVQLIEQDAKQDFPDFEEFVIEPSETDDDKIEVKEREKTSEDPIEGIDSFTNRVEKFKHLGESETDLVKKPILEVPTSISPAITIASYFDTGNYAAETHYRNSLTSPSSVNAFLGSPNQSSSSIHTVLSPNNTDNIFKAEKPFEASLITPDPSAPFYPDDIRNPRIPETTTQTPTTCTVSYGHTELTSSVTYGSSSLMTSATFGSSKDIMKAEEIAIGAELPDAHLADLIKDIKLCEETPMKLPAFASAFQNKFLVDTEEQTEMKEVERANDKPAFNVSANVLANLQPVLDVPKMAQTPIAPTNLPDPKNFFSSAVEAKTENTSSDAGCNRLASYFATPAKNTDHTKSFFELSQSQDHLRKEDSQNRRWENTQSDKSFFDEKEETEEPSKPDPKVHKTFFELSKNKDQQKVQATAENKANINEEDTYNRRWENTQSDKSFFKETPEVQEPIKPEPNNKMFFELNQNKDQQKAQATAEYNADINFMKNLTSLDNYVPNQEQVVRTVNYFTIEYDNSFIDRTIPEDLKYAHSNGDGIVEYADYKSETVNNTNTELEETTINYTEDERIIVNCKQCCKFISNRVKNVAKINVNSEEGRVKKGVNEVDSAKGPGDMSNSANIDAVAGKPANGSFDLTMEDNGDETLDMLNDARSQAEYSPVKHHWFYRVDLDGKSTWKGFSVADSRSLERAFNSPDLNESTVVPTDGGRFDVNVMGRLRVAVYWSDKPTNVRRCSWFYKGTTDSRYVPYSESIAEKLEEEYRLAATTGVWHRRLSLPNRELVVLHGPAVMAHLQPGAADAWTTPAQSTSRPRVVRRGCEESELEDDEPTSIDHLLLLCHGVGSACDMRFRGVEEVVDDFRATSMQLIQGHYRSSYENGTIGRIEVLPISWHSTLHSGDSGVDRRLARITLDSIPRLRSFTNDTVLDVLFYTSPMYCQTIIDTVCKEINRIYELFKSRNPGFTGGVSLGGHSLGSVILYDLLCHQVDETSPTSPAKTLLGGAGAGPPSITYPALKFRPAALYALGSPIAMFECIRGVEHLGPEFRLPTCPRLFNIFHPYDPVAYRIEPLINPQLKEVPPSLIPHHKGRKRMHLELKETVARVGADLKQKLVESIKSTWASVWRTPPPNTLLLEKVVEEELEKEVNKEEEAIDTPPASPAPVDVSQLLGALNGGARVDHVLQEAPFEMINEYLFAMSSHVGYWESEDTMLLMLREMYSSLGVRPDGSAPPPSMQLQRARPPTEEERAFATTEDASTSGDV
ncbi:hypothetical protein JYU34_007978 [Plutella xylostella]|uniref:WWE domain-containing protein n=1 Tax=Plutella xylostella TaxID=51655 RepID=A0ABQ7QNI6_PLUXY|nr:hypothetical protein JYU34_007978 [Plutella xylostella]